jgi:hypothetical protein
VIGIPAIALGIVVMFAAYKVKDRGFVGYLADDRLSWVGMILVTFGLSQTARSLQTAKKAASELRTGASELKSRISGLKLDHALPKVNLLVLRLATGAGVLAVTTVAAMYFTNDVPFDGVTNDGTFGSSYWAQGESWWLIAIWWVISIVLVGLTVPFTDEHDAGDLKVVVAMTWAFMGFPGIFMMVYAT